MSNSIMFNCVSESDCAIPSAKSICTDTQDELRN